MPYSKAAAFIEKD